MMMMMMTTMKPSLLAQLIGNKRTDKNTCAASWDDVDGPCHDSSQHDHPHMSILFMITTETMIKIIIK